MPNDRSGQAVVVVVVRRSGRCRRRHTIPTTTLMRARAVGASVGWGRHRRGDGTPRKDILLVSMGALLWDEVVTLHSIGGYGVALVGLGYYNYVGKLRAAAPSPSPLAKPPSPSPLAKLPMPAADRGDADDVDVELPTVARRALDDGDSLVADAAARVGLLDDRSHAHGGA